MNLISWMIGYRTAPVQELKSAIEIEEEFVFISSNNSGVDRNRLKVQLPEFPIHELDLSASVCCVQDAGKQIESLSARIPRPLPMPKSFQEEGPYTLAFWSQVKKSEAQYSKALYFLNSQILEARSSMQGTEKIQLFSGRKLSCASQLFVDLPRWSKSSHLVIEGEAHSLGVFQDPSLNVGISQNRAIPVKAINLLDAMRDHLCTDDKFLLFTRYFNQGPLNDMVYSMMTDASRQWEASLIPDQKSMQRTFHLVTDRDTKVKKVMIVVRGYFDAGFIEGIGMLEPEGERKLGSFYGVTIVNLDTGAAYVHTHVEAFKNEWKAV
jgi:hypothetical protein